MNLTPEQLAALRASMATAAGWVIRPRADGEGWTLVSPNGIAVAGGSKAHCLECLQGWATFDVNDLNAVHRLEEKLTDEQASEFNHSLEVITYDHKKSILSIQNYSIHASALLRCLALDRTLNPTNPIV